MSNHETQFLPPPRSPDDVAYSVTAQHVTGGTYSTIERTPEAAVEAMRRQCASFPQSYKSIGSPRQCEVIADPKLGLLWKVCWDLDEILKRDEVA